MGFRSVKFSRVFDVCAFCKCNYKFAYRKFYHKVECLYFYKLSYIGYLKN